jgi:hypothetical protein
LFQKGKNGLINTAIQLNGINKVRNLQLKFGLKAEYKIGNIKQKINKSEKEKKKKPYLAHLAATAHHRSPAPQPTSQPSNQHFSPTDVHVPIRQDKTEDEVVVFVFAIVDARESASAMERDTSRPPLLTENSTTTAEGPINTPPQSPPLAFFFFFQFLKP